MVFGFLFLVLKFGKIRVEESFEFIFCEFLVRGCQLLLFLCAHLGFSSVRNISSD
jgi:hypothetical protein